MLDRVWEILGWVFALNGAAFQTITTGSGGLGLALTVAFLAQLSLAIAQGIVLFINRVKPIRFVFSLLTTALLSLFEFLFLVFSTWLICQFPTSIHLSLPPLIAVLGLSYAPLLFSFLGALPYLGSPILRILSIWHLLAMVVGFGVVANCDLEVAFGYVAFGWAMKQLLTNTIGQPIARLGQRFAKWVAGVDLVANRSELAAMLESGLGLGSPAIALEPSPQPATWNYPQSTPRVPTATTQPSEVGLSAVIAASANPSEDMGVRIEHWWQRIPQPIRLGFILLGMLLFLAIVAILLRPIRLGLLGWYGGLPRIGRWIFNLSWIGVIATVFAGLLAPLEALGWWAGWYGDEVDTRSQAAVPPVSNPQSDRTISRYLVYLDGVGQSGSEYTPDVEEFVEALQAALPEDVEFVRGLMMYSVFNRPLDRDRPLAWVWRLADAMRWQNPAALLGIILNLRNVLIVAVSADRRYGPIYNQGIAQVLYNGLVQHGYQPQEGVPITLIGYSGGGQMAAAAAPYLKRVLVGEIEIVSLGGVLSANNNFFKLEHLYHLVGDRDGVAGLGPIIFPGRTRFFPLSYWNRALRKGKITQISLGPMGHQVPGGIMDPNALLANGESHLQHTVAVIGSILDGQLLVAAPPRPKKVSNYEHYKQADFNDYSYYPLTQSVDRQWYLPIAPWMGRLILPQPGERRQVRGVWLEVHHADRGYESLVGKRVILRWAEDATVKQWVRAVTRDVHFSVDAEYSSQYGGSIHPDRLNHWQQVDPLESLAGAHPRDDLIVMLAGTVEVESEANFPIVRIAQQPVEITGRYYGLVRFIAPVANSDRFQVRHFDRTSREFDGETESVLLPPVLLAKDYGSYPSTTNDLERSPLNESGWYIYGAKDADGIFVVQSLAPRSLLRLQPDRVVFNHRSSYRYIRQEAWADAKAQKGQISSVLCVSNPQSEEIQAAIDDWQEGDRALLLHVYGGIGGNKKEPAAATPLYFGHFAYGLATVIREPLSDELRFEIQYYQVYAQNTDGLTAGTLHWSRYMGDRQFGWSGNRPICDILVKFEPFTGYFDLPGGRRSVLNNMLNQLQAMTARYRIGDGTGATYVGPANNCAQDSNQALFASIGALEDAIAAFQPQLQTWLDNDPIQARRYQQLLNLRTQLRSQLQPLGSPRSDWQANQFNLGTTLEDAPLRNLWTGLGSWRTLLPRKASDTIVEVFLQHGAAVWVLRTNQIGGCDRDIEPIAPMTL
ncbi:MAG: CAAX protease [Cyanosarcina radialis HA8281-LM2]|jgi:predicted Abi (CAAX) family protease|nr:CAAX protease [Cyanosarcina radialis HA8281-LM2]